MLRCESPGEMQFERGEHCKHQLKARVGEAVIEFFVDMGRVGSGVGEAGGGGINPPARGFLFGTARIPPLLF